MYRTPGMKFSFSQLLVTITLFVGMFAPLQASEDAFSDAKAIIRDMSRIETPNGVQDLFTAEIGDIDQWVSVRGKDRDNPLLLFVHGGPASPMMPVSWTFQRGWEDYFTVVQWDQRGAGKTYSVNDPDTVAPTIAIDRFVRDTVEMIDLLRKRYDKRKVILVGHSWGTIIGLQAAIERPEWIHAYVGIGQVISVLENERVSYEFALRTARQNDNKTAVKELESLAPYPGDEPLTREKIIQQRRWAQHYGGLSAYRDESTYFYRAPRLSPLYDAEDVAAINKGSLLTLDRILQEWMSVDYREVEEVDFPVVMFMGRHDYTTPSEPTAQWLEKLRAPSKRGVWFEHSSHLVPIEEPGRTLVTLVTEVRPFAE